MLVSQSSFGCFMLAFCENFKERVNWNINKVGDFDMRSAVLHGQGCK